MIFYDEEIKFDHFHSMYILYDANEIPYLFNLQLKCDVINNNEIRPVKYK